jgi:hypothetical protein
MHTACPLWVMNCRGTVKVACPLYSRKLPQISATGAAVKGQEPTFDWLLDHLVGAQEYRLGNCQPKRLCSLKVDR